MGYDGSGNYTRTHNFSSDASAGIKILAARMDAEFNDFASAMPLALLKDGRNAATANLPMGGFRHTNVGAPVSATNYMRSKDFIENVPIYMVDAEASADRISVSAAFYTTASAATAPRDGSHILVKAGSDKSSAVAIRLNTGDGSPHSAGVVLANGSALFSGAIRSGGIYEFIWSSSDTAWQLFNPQVDYASSAYPGVVLLALQSEVDAGTDVPKAVTPAQLASKFSASYATITSAGLVELATTAEVQAGTNISAVITPAALVYASTTFMGPIEIATTAEVLGGTDATRAVTPAAAKAAYGAPYIVVARLVNAAVSVVSRNQAAVSCSVSIAGAILSFVYGSAPTSVGGVAIQIFGESSSHNRINIAQANRNASTFSFIVSDASTGSTISNLTASVFLNIQVNRLV